MLQYIADVLSYQVFNLWSQTRLWQVVNFFIYDSIKILLLVFTIVFVIAFVRTFLSPHTMKEIASKQKYWIWNIFASLFWAMTPFCSCSWIPVFIGFLEAEIPMGIAFSFLITSPLVNEVVFILMGGTFAWTIAFLYALSGILLWVIAGIVLGKMKLEKEVILKFSKVGEKNIWGNTYLPKTMQGKLLFSTQEAVSVFKNLWLIIIIGIFIWAIIHGYVPQEFFEKYIPKNSLFAVPLATLIGVPIYAWCSTLVPIIFPLTLKWVWLGTALAFMMGASGLSLPEAIMLKKVISLKLLAIFFGIVTLGIIIIGYLFNMIS